MLSGWAPSLEELCAADNDLSDVLSVVTDSNGKKVEGFSCLRLLDLSETRLASWDQVGKRSHASFFSENVFRCFDVCGLSYY